MLLTEATYSPRQRFFAADATLRFASSLVRRPRSVARRLNGLAHRARSGGRRGRGDRAVPRRPPLERSVLDREPLPPPDAGLSGDRDGARRADSRRRPRPPDRAARSIPDREPPRRPLAGQLRRGRTPRDRAAVSTRGTSFVHGAEQFASDIRSAPRLPSMVDTTKFEVGGNLAATPGSVIAREDAFELIHYAPQTDEVRSVPLLLVPPMINKFYIADLAPGRSLVEYLVSQGQQVFVVSWRNPEAEHGSWGLDYLAEAILSGLDVACAVGESEQAHCLPLRWWDRRRLRRRPPGGDRRTGPARWADPGCVRARQRAVRGPERVHQPRPRPRGALGSRPERATSTEALSLNCSLGCGRTT